jgi:hypothetical protein
MRLRAPARLDELDVDESGLHAIQVATPPSLSEAVSRCRQVRISPLAWCGSPHLQAV